MPWTEQVTADNILGLYINTNKTGLDRKEGYEIPWCDDELAKNLTMMAEWQREYNPIVEPVSCAERGKISENPDVIRSMKKAFPLFRDPADPQNRPISRDMIARYFDDLMYVAEVEISERRGRPIKLTKEVNINKGNGKTERRHVSRFDIHTLRVSGITALLEAGLPPDMVMSLAGHSTIAMTMWYTKPSIISLNKKLSAIMERTKFDLDDVELTEERLESVSAFLMNSRPEQDQAGFHLLREVSGRGDGGVEVMAHGICPGGECSTGGAFANNEQIGYAPVPRRLACSLCRYRLTGPMFLPGLVANANRLVFEIRRKGQEIAKLNDEIQTAGEASNDAALKRSRVRALYRETDVICQEWAAEVVYARTAKKSCGAQAGPRAQSISNERRRRLGMYQYVEARNREQRALLPRYINRSGSFSLEHAVDQIEDSDVRDLMRDTIDRLASAEAALARAKYVLKTMRPGVDIDAIISGRESRGGQISGIEPELIDKASAVVTVLSDENILRTCGLAFDNGAVRRRGGTRDELVSPESMKALSSLFARLKRL